MLEDVFKKFKDSKTPVSLQLFINHDFVLFPHHVYGSCKKVLYNKGVYVFLENSNNPLLESKFIEYYDIKGIYSQRCR